MSDLSKVKEINVVGEMAYANKHLANGWILIAVNSVSGSDNSGNSGNSNVSTEYVLGWEDALPSNSVSQYDDEAVTSKYASQYEDDNALEPELTKPKHKPITIID